MRDVSTEFILAARLSEAEGLDMTNAGGGVEGLRYAVRSAARSAADLTKTAADGRVNGPHE